MQKKQPNKAPSQLSADDTKLFQDAVRDIKPLSHDNIPLNISHITDLPERIHERIHERIPEEKSIITKPHREDKGKIHQPSSLDESLLFRDAVKDITPLLHDKATHEIIQNNKKTLTNTTDDDLVSDILSDEAEVEKINPTDILSYCHVGIQKRVFKKLRRGQYITIDELDLHGLNVKQAKNLLLHFLEIALQVEGSCISIIHGKGHRSSNKEPVIKRQTNHWLQQHPRVLAFHSAQAKDGGTGAVYVLLRRTQLSD